VTQASVDDAPEAAMVTSHTRSPSTVTVDEARELIADDALLIDVRTTKEWDAGHTPSSVHIPLEEIPEAIGIMPRVRRVVVLSRSGRRAAEAVIHLRTAQVEAAALHGGLRAWVAAGGDLLSTDGGTAKIA
jgi:rhodanese-related sulfurtransferase